MVYMLLLIKFIDFVDLVFFFVCFCIKIFLVLRIDFFRFFVLEIWNVFVNLVLYCK